MGLEYASEKLGSAIGMMAQSTAPLQKRLEHAFMTFHPIRPDEDLPTEELKSLYADITEALTADKSDSHSGYVPTTTSRMSDEMAASVIEKIVALGTLVYLERLDRVRST